MSEEIEKPPEKGKAVTPPPEEERPAFDLMSLIKERGKRVEGLGVPEAILLMDYYDRRDDRLWRREQAQRAPSSSSPETEALKKDLSDLKESVKTLMDTIQTMRQTEAQKAFADGIVKSINEQITPTIKALETRIASIEETQKATPPAATPQTPSELSEAIKGFTKAVDALGEKAGARALTLGDVDVLLGIIDKVKTTIPKSEVAGEFDWRTTGITTFGEIGKELISAYKEIESKRPREEIEAEKTTPEARKIIERQVYNHVMKLIAGGAKDLNIYETADALGLTPRQVYEAVETLKSKGYLRITAPSKVGGAKAGEAEKAFEEEGEVIKPPS
jgi:hypothetical protein